MRRILLALALVGLAIMTFGGLDLITDEGKNSKKPKPKPPVAIQVQGALGADVSEYQDTIDWVKFAQERQFVFIRVSHGIYHDVQFARNWDEAKKNGVLRGVYHYIVPTEDFAEQLKYFVNTVKLEPGDLPPVLDVEDEKLWGKMKQADRLKYILKWADALERIYGVKPILYMSSSFVDSMLGGAQAADVLKNYPLWVANYNVATPWVPLPWTSYIVWQYSNTQKCAGVPAPNLCDQDIAPGTLFDLKRHVLQTGGGGDASLLTAKELDDEGLTVKKKHEITTPDASQHKRKKRMREPVNHHKRHRGED